MQRFTARWRRSDGWSAPLPAWDGEQTLVLAFGDRYLDADPDPLAALAKAFPDSVVMGCSTSGEILDDRLDDGSLSVAVVRFARTRLRLEVAAVPHPARSGEVGLDLGRRLRAGAEPPAAVFALSDGTRVNGSALAAGLTEGVGGGVPISGGLAGDGERFERTWVLVDGEPRAGYVTAVGLYGTQLQVGHGCRGGWRPLGPERLITRAEGNLLLELDGQPALDLYRTYLGERAAGLPATALLFPLTVRAPGSDQELVRTVLGIDEGAKSMTFAGDVPEGSTAQLMHATTDRLVDAAQAAAESAFGTGHVTAGGTAGGTAGEAPDGPFLTIAVTCVGRRLYLGQRTEDELDAVCTATPGRSGIVGFYSYGELAPVASGSCELHNQTMTLTTISERP